MPNAIGESNSLSFKETASLFFGSPYKVQLGIWIVKQEVGVPFDIYGVSEGVVVPENGGLRVNVYRYTGIFEEAKLIERVGQIPPPPTKRVQWTRLENPFWIIFKAAAEAQAEYL